MEVVVAAATGIILRGAVTSIAAAVAAVIRLAVASVARPGVAAAIAASVRPCGKGHPAPYQGAEQQK